MSIPGVSSVLMAQPHALVHGTSFQVPNFIELAGLANGYVFCITRLQKERCRAEICQAWNPQTGHCDWSLELGGDEYSRFIGDEEVYITIATYGLGCAARVWEKNSRRFLWEAYCPNMLIDGPRCIGLNMAHNRDGQCDVDYIHIWNKITGAVLQIIQVPDLNHWTLYCDNGLLFGLTQTGTLFTWDQATGRLLYSFDNGGKLVFVRAFNDSQLICGNDQWQVFVLNKKEGHYSRTFSAMTGRDTCPLFRVHEINTRHLIVSDRQGTLYVLDKNTGALLYHKIQTGRSKIQTNESFLLILNRETQMLEILDKITGACVLRREKIGDFIVDNNILVLAVGEQVCVQDMAHLTEKTDQQ